MGRSNGRILFTEKETIPMRGEIGLPDLVGRIYTINKIFKTFAFPEQK